MELVRLPHAVTSLPRAALSFPQRRRIAAKSLGRIQTLAAFLVSNSTVKNAWALDYNELVQSTTTSTTSGVAGGIDLDAAAIDGLDFSVVQSVVSFISDNPAAVIGGALAIAVPVIVSKLFGGTKTYGAVAAKYAFEKLASKDAAFQLLDIRDAADIKVEGTPDLRKFRKRVVQLPYAQYEDEAGFVAKVLTKFKDPSSTTLYILDRFDGNSSKVAKLLATSGFKAAYAVKDGAEGQRGWQKSELPWLLPRKGLTLNLDVLKDVIQTDDLVPVTLGIAAAAGAGLVVFSEAETALQIVGTAALLQLFVRRFLFAEDRKKTLTELKTFLDTKIAPKELADEIKALIPRTATTENENGSASTVQEEPRASSPYTQYPDTQPPSSPSPSPPTLNESPPPTATTAPPDAPPSDEASAPRPLSPYPMYPDLKPPSSPTPNRP